MAAAAGTFRPRSPVFGSTFEKQQSAQALPLRSAGVKGGRAFQWNFPFRPRPGHQFHTGVQQRHQTCAAKGAHWQVTVRLRSWVMPARWQGLAGKGGLGIVRVLKFPWCMLGLAVFCTGSASPNVSKDRFVYMWMPEHERHASWPLLCRTFSLRFR